MKGNSNKFSFDLSSEMLGFFEQRIINFIPEPLLVLDSHLRVIFVNNSFFTYFEVDPSDTMGKFIYDLGNGEWDIPVLRRLLEDVLQESLVINDFKIKDNFKNIGKKTLLIKANRVDLEDLEPKVLISINDISEYEKVEESCSHSNGFHGEVSKDITAHKRFKNYHEFMAEISNDLLKIHNIKKGMDKLSEKIGRYFDVHWCMFSELTKDLEYSVTSYGWNDENVPSLKGTYKMSDFLSEKQLARHNAGKLSIVNNTQTNPNVNAESYGALDIMSFILVPISRDGQWQFLLSIIDNKSHEWLNEEISVIQEITNLIWTRLEQIRVEKALKISNEKLQSKSENLREINETLESNVKKRTKELFNERKRLSTVLETIPVMLCLLTPDYHIAFANKAFRDNLGNPNGKYCYEHCFGLSEPCDFCESFKVLETGKPHMWECDLPDGRTIEAYDYPFKDTDGSPLILEMEIDVTEQRQAHEVLTDLNKTLENRVKKRTKELEQSNKELEQFAYITSHDLREPLRMITSFLQLIEKRYNDQLDQTGKEFIEFAVDGAKRLDAMTNDLLEYSRISSQKWENTSVDFEHVLKEALINLKVPIEENDAIITHDPLPTIIENKQLKVHLLQNLIGNAIKYRSKEAPKIHVSATKEKNQYLFSIKDNGIGIAKDHLEKIFTIFNRLHTHDEYEGTGIGLAIAQKIVHQQGGEI